MSQPRRPQLLTNTATSAPSGFYELPSCLDTCCDRSNSDSIEKVQTILKTTTLPEITILYQVEEIENLSRLNLLFWNAGKATIRAVDVPSAGGPCVEFVSGARVLSHTLKGTSSEEIGFRVVRETGNLLRLNFEYLNPGDGAVIEVLYKAIGQEKKPTIKLRAPIKGAPPAEVIKYEGQPSLADFLVTSVCAAVAALIAFGFLLSGLLLPGESVIARIPLVTVGAFLCTLLVRSIYGLVGRYLKSRVPDFARPYFE